MLQGFIYVFLYLLASSMPPLSGFKSRLQTPANLLIVYFLKNYQFTATTIICLYMVMILVNNHLLSSKAVTIIHSIIENLSIVT